MTGLKSKSKGNAALASSTLRHEDRGAEAWLDVFLMLALGAVASPDRFAPGE
jgi:hypothetical protein